MLDTNPVLVDTAPVRIGTPGNRIYVREVVWQNPAAQGDILILAVNRRAIRRVATAANTPHYIFRYPLGWVNTLGVHQIDSGILEVWIDEA